MKIEYVPRDKTQKYWVTKDGKIYRFCRTEEEAKNYIKIYEI